MAVSLIAFVWMICLKIWFGTSMVRTPLPILSSAMLFKLSIVTLLMGFLAEILVRTYFEAQNRLPYSVRKTINVQAGPPVMCGLAGFAGAGTRGDLERMTDALVHRGPDGPGFHCDDDVAVFLGHRRLAILDVASGQQPMWNESRDVAVIFNGEIYNHTALRCTLAAKGHRFASAHSDTEVLVHGWEEWGEDLPARLNSMFAFALFDRRKHQLFLARDRFGKSQCFMRKARRISFSPARLGHCAAAPRWRRIRTWHPWPSCSPMAIFRRPTPYTRGAANCPAAIGRALT